MPERTTRYQKKRNIQSDQIKSKVVSKATPPRQSRPSPRTPQPQQRDPEREQRIVKEQQTLQSKDILTGRTIERDQLGVEEESDSYKEGPQGFLEGVYAPTQQITQMPKDIIEGVPIENQAMRPSMIDLAIQPVIGTLAAAKELGYTEKSWYSPVGWFDNKALPEFLNRNPDEQRDFFTGMSDNFGIIGDTVTNERWIDDVNKGVDFDQDGKVDMVGYDQTLNVFNPDSEIRKYPAYYIGSAIGEVPYFLSPAIAIRGPVQTAKILASATRIAGKASLSMKNINVTSKMGNAGKNIVKSVQKEQKNIGTDAPVNTKAANEGMDLLEKNIDNQIQVKENLSIKMSKEGLSDNKLTKTVDDLENEIAILRAEKADLRTSHTSALNRFNEIRNNYKSGKASIDEVDDARSRYITVVQRGVEDKVATTYKANNKDIIRKYEAISELHRVRTTTKIRELQKKVDDGNLTERQTQRTKSKIDKLERSLQDELPRADRVARAIEGAPDDAMAYVKKIVPKHRWSSLGREVEQTVDSQGIQVYGTKKTKYEDMYKRYDGNEVLAGIVYAMRKSREGLGFAFHKTEKSLTEQIQFKMRERVVTVGDASRPELGMISFRAGDSVEASTRVKAAYGDVRASMARRDKIRADEDAMTPFEKGNFSKKDDFKSPQMAEAEMDVEAKMNVLSEIMGEYEPISDFKVTQLVDDADGSRLITNYADVKRGKGDDFIKVEPTSDIQVTVATRIPDVQIEKLGKGLYQGSVGKEMTVIAQKTDVRQIQSILGKDATYLTKGNEWLFKSYQAKDPVSLRGGRSLSQGNAYVQVPAGMKIEDYLFMQQRLGLDTPESIQVGIKKYKAWQKYNTPKNRKGYSKKAWRRVTKERGIYAPDTLEGGVLVPYKKLDSIPRKDIYGEDKSALSQSTVRVDLEQEFKMDGTTATLKLFPDEGSPTIDVGDVITNREIFEGRLRPDMVESDLSDIRNSRDRVRTDIANLSDEIVTLKKETEGIVLPSGVSEKNLGFYSPETKAQLLKGQKSIGEAKDYAKEKKVRLTELKNEIIALKGKLSGDDLEVLKQRVGELDGELTSMEYGLTTLDPNVLGLARQRHEWNSAIYSNKVSDDLVEEYNAIDQERHFAMSKYENIREGRYTDTKSKQLQLDADIARLELQSKELAKKQTKTRDGAFDGISSLKKAVDQTLAIKKSMKANTVVREFEEIENITPKVAMTPEEAAKYNSSGTRVSVENIVAKLQAEKLGITKKKYELNQNAWGGIQYRKLNKYGTRTLELKRIGGQRRIGEMTKYLIMRDKDKRAYDEGVKSDIAIDNLLKDKIKKKESIALKESQLVGKQAELERTYTRLTAKEQQLEHVTKQFKGLEDFPGAISIPRGQLATWTEKTLAQQGGTTPVSKPLYFESGKRRFEIVTMVRAEKEDRLLALNVRRDSMIKQGYASDTKQRLQVNKEISDFKADQSNYRLTAIDYDAKISGKGIERISESELMVMFKTETGAKAYKVLEDVQEALAKKVEPKKQPDGTINKSVAQRALGTILPTIKKVEGVIEQPIALVRSVTGGRVKPVYGKGADYAKDAIITDTRIITGDWKHYKLSAVLETTDKVGLLGASKGTYPVGVKVQQIYKMAKPTETNEPFRGTSAIERISTYRDSEVYIPIGQRFKDKALPVQVWDELERKMSNQPMRTNLRKSVVQQYLINIKNVELDVASKRADKIIRKVDGKDSEEFTNIIESVMTPDTFRRPTTFESVTSKGLTRKTPSGKEQVITPRFKKIWRTEVSPGVRKGFVDINEIERDIGVTFRTSGKGTVRDRGIAYIQDTFGMKVPTGAGNVREQIVRKALLEQARDKQPWHKFSRKNRKLLDSGTRVESAEELAILTSELKAIDEGTATSFGQKGKKVFKEPFKEKGTDEAGPSLPRTVETKDEMILRIKNQIEAEEGVTFSEILSGDVRMQLQKRMNELKDKRSNVMNKGGDTTEINAEVSSILTTLSKDEKVKRTIDQRYFEKVNQAKESRPQRKPYYAGFGSYTGATIGTLGSQAIPMAFAEEQQPLGVDLRPPTVSENTIQAPIQIQQPLTEQLTKVTTEEARLIGQQSAFRLDVTPKGIQSSILTPALATGTSLATLPGLMLSSAQGQMYRYTTVSQIQPPPAQRQTLEVPRPPGLVPPAQRVTPPYVAGWPPWLENELDDRRKQKGKFKKKQKQFWTVPDQWWKPGYWQKKKDSFTGKYDYTGTGYGTFKGKEGKRLKNTWDMQ